MKNSVPKEYIDLTKKLISFKSVSPDPKCKTEIKKASEWLRSVFKDAGFKTEFLKTKDSNPILLATYDKIKGAETILIYGHYDVQPAEKSDGWKTDPYTLTQKGNRLYARGAIDNKGQVMVHISTVFRLIKEGRLKYNVKFMIEGDEETGSMGMLKTLRANRAKLKSDHILISDGETQNNKPSIDIAFRGCGNFKVTFRTAKNNLHSGLYGGAVPNAANELASFLSKIHDEENKVVLPGFYDDVDVVPGSVKSSHKDRAKSIDCKKIAGVNTFLCEKDHDFYTQVGLRPSFQITSFESGYIGDGYMNIVPSTASAKINIRIVASQDPKKVIDAIKKYFKENIPSYVTMDFEVGQLVFPSKMTMDSEMSKYIQDILKRVYKNDVVFNYTGGSLPIILDFQTALGLDPISVSLANSDCNMHGVGENFSIPMLQKALKFSETLFSR